MKSCRIVFGISLALAMLIANSTIAKPTEKENTDATVLVASPSPRSAVLSASPPVGRIALSTSVNAKPDDGTVSQQNDTPKEEGPSEEQLYDDEDFEEDEPQGRSGRKKFRQMPDGPPTPYKLLKKKVRTSDYRQKEARQQNFPGPGQSEQPDEP